MNNKIRELEAENKINMARSRVQGKAFAGLEDLLKAEKEAEAADMLPVVDVVLCVDVYCNVEAVAPFAV
jgi:hypothetical protein